MSTKWALQQQGPDEPAFILSEDNRFIARFDEATDDEKRLAVSAPQLLDAAIRARQLLEDMHGHWPGAMSIDARDCRELIDAAICNAKA